MSTSTPPKTGAQRWADFAEAKRKAGLKMLRNLWARPEHEATIRAFAADEQAIAAYAAELQSRPAADKPTR